MGNLIAITVNLTDATPENEAQLEAELSALGLGSTLPITEGGNMDVPKGTFVATIDEGEPMEHLTHFYRSFVEVMRKLNLHGSYMVNVGQKPCYSCGKL